MEGITIGGYSFFSLKNKNTRKKNRKKKKGGSGHFSDAGSSCAGGGELDPGLLDDLESQPCLINTSEEQFVSLKYATSVTIRQSLRTSTGSRAKRREKTMVFGLSSHPGAGTEYAETGGASLQPSPLSPHAPSLASPRPRPSSSRSVDEVLQNSVRGFREPWWKTPCSSLALDEDEDSARADEAEGCCFGSIADCDMPAETQVCVCCCTVCKSLLQTLSHTNRSRLFRTQRGGRSRGGECIQLTPHTCTQLEIVFLTTVSIESSLVCSSL